MTGRRPRPLFGGARLRLASRDGRRGRQSSRSTATSRCCAIRPRTGRAPARARLAASLAYGTRINDALMRSLTLLREAKVSSGSIVLLSDGADIGSLHSLDEAVAAAKEQRVRVFTVGLRSGAFDARRFAGSPIRPGLVRRGSFGVGARLGLRGARRPAGRGIPHPVSLRRASEFGGHGRRSGRRHGQSRHELRGADALTAASVPPIARVEVPALGKLAAADQPGVRAARLRAAAPARAAAEIHRRRPCTDVRARDFLRAPRPGDGGCCGASRNPEPLRERLVGSARA